MGLKTSNQVALKEIEQKSKQNEQEFLRLQQIEKQLNERAKAITNAERADTRMQVEKAFDFAVRTAPQDTTVDAVIADAKRYLGEIDAIAGERANVA